LEKVDDFYFNDFKTIFQKGADFSHLSWLGADLELIVTETGDAELVEPIWSRFRADLEPIWSWLWQGLVMCEPVELVDLIWSRFRVDLEREKILFSTILTPFLKKEPIWADFSRFELSWKLIWSWLWQGLVMPSWWSWVGADFELIWRREMIFICNDFNTISKKKPISAYLSWLGADLELIVTGVGDVWTCRAGRSDLEPISSWFGEGRWFLFSTILTPFLKKEPISADLSWLGADLELIVTGVGDAELVEPIWSRFRADLEKVDDFYFQRF
jgi:hypothetical protein